MVKQRSNSAKPPQANLSLLLVGVPSHALERKLQLLHQAGFVMTIAESICHAEIFSEAQYFDGAVYDESLSEEEQVSLARIQRVRWPWMRLIRCGHAPLTITQDAIFDATSASEAALPEAVAAVLIG